MAPPPLLEGEGRRAGPAAAPEATVRRRRPVQVLRQTLDRLDPRGGGWLRLDFFEDASFRAQLREKRRFGPAAYTWTGDLPGVAGGSVVVSVAGDVVIANVWTAHEGSYELRSLPGGGHEARQLDPAAFPECADGEKDDEPEATDEAATGGGGGGSSCLEDGSFIDLLVVYTQEAEDGIGGPSAMQAEIQAMEASTNAAYANSAIATRIRVVGSLLVDYEESGESATDRSRLRNPSDGYMDEVHPLRDALYADVVSLVVHDIENCGRAYFAIGPGNTPEPEDGFHVVQRSCAVGNLSFAHELGHNQGSRHDTDDSNVPFAFSHGYNQGQVFRTVMAVCCDPQRVAHFSNPDVLYQGLSTGTAADADNARSIDLTAANVANFRCNPIECSDGVDNDGDGLADEADPGCDDHADASERSAGLPCDDGLDNDGDGGTDFDPATFASPGDSQSSPAGSGDPGCKAPDWHTENPRCQNGEDDGLALADYDGGRNGPPGSTYAGISGLEPDPGCVGEPWKDDEACGLGPELALLLGTLLGLRRRR